MDIQSTVQDMFHRLITNVPRNTAIRYLQKVYPKMTTNEIAIALNRTVLDLQCNYDEKRDYLTMYKGPQITPDQERCCANAFRVAVEMMDSTQQIMYAGFPFYYYVINRGRAYAVCYIPTGSETSVSRVVAERKVLEDDRDTIRRIAVVDYGVQLDYIRRVGFSKIARVNDDNEVEILKSISQDEAWADVEDFI